MKIFVTGATGYIGFQAAAAFRRAGHEVWGMARSDVNARRLARHEITPVPGRLEEPETYREAARDCSVIVHAAADSRGDMPAMDRQAMETLLSIKLPGAPPKTVIYTSGVWVYGDTHGRLVDETSPLNPAGLVTWRPAVEEMVLEASGVRGIVIRPGCVYGRQGGLTGMWFAGASPEKPPAVIGNGENYWAMVHVDDLAEAYLLAAESGLGGEAFNITDRSRWKVGQMAEAAARAAGSREPVRHVPVTEASAQMGLFAEALSLDQHVDARKAVRLLGWQPKHGGFVDEVDTYFAAWQAARHGEASTSS